MLFTTIENTLKSNLKFSKNIVTASVPLIKLTLLIDGEEIDVDLTLIDEDEPHWIEKLS